MSKEKALDVLKTYWGYPGLRGLQADIIAVRGNPLEDVSLLREIPFVLKDGEIVKAP